MSREELNSINKTGFVQSVLALGNSCLSWEKTCMLTRNFLFVNP